MENVRGSLLFMMITLLNSACSRVSYGNFTYKTALNVALLNGYNPSVHPGQNYGTQKLNVNVGFDLFKIQEFDELASVFTITGVLTVTWFDERLKWTPRNYSNLNITHFKQKDIWTPPFVLSNSYHNIDLIGYGDMTLKLKYHGEVNWFLPLKLSSSCDADVMYYPNDEQSCSLELLPWGYTGDYMQLTVPNPILETNTFTKNPTWDLVSTFQKAFSSPKLGYKMGITFKRKPLFFMVNFIMPTIFLSFINMMVFLLPAESGERVGYSITVLLAMAVFLSTITTILPQTSTPNMALLCYLFIAHIGQSLLIMICTIFGLRFYLRFPEDHVPRWISGLTRFACTCAKSATCNVHLRTPNAVSEIKITDHDGVEIVEDTGSSLSVDAVTWQCVGKAFDRVCCVFFLMTSISYNTGFLVVMYY
ncbi:acetylcholine receptor subunit beta-type lev-1-like [Ylistrum balloti]|uniref:acetylcholine receptor subunit beta-type lev-1-like n=1 Tax=Ylistrum balloti TaxID=509963 RepID=UPI002905B81A|nr:acetylcholine receptor subunit beta-type lev-1-like [Ylistrum balloti]